MLYSAGPKYFDAWNNLMGPRSQDSVGRFASLIWLLYYKKTPRETRASRYDYFTGEPIFLHQLAWSAVVQTN